jgi:hypothetical protein
MENVKKPESTFQTFEVETNTLTVYNGADETTGIYFKGIPEDYDGTATEPAAPTAEYEAKHAEVKEEEVAE